ncbi:hypothetical protein DLM45_02265 [Hyphomicrobium methylovorum]|nr:hypothetical protein [Hyphomicrobium methylovorum]
MFRGDPERWKPLFMFVCMTIGMGLLGVFVRFATSPENWHWYAGFWVVMGVIIWKFWDYRPPD